MMRDMMMDGGMMWGMGLIGSSSSWFSCSRSLPW